MTAAAELRSVVERFVAAAKEPAVLDSTEQPFRLVDGNWDLSEWNGRLLIQVWDDERNLVRKVTGLAAEKRDRLLLNIERFPKAEGEMQIADLAAPLGAELEKRGQKSAFRERFGSILAREFAGWSVEEISSEPNLEDSLSPSYLRATIRQGNTVLALLAAPPQCGDYPGIVPFGVIWLDYVRRRDSNRAVSGLLLFCPTKCERDVIPRVRLLAAPMACRLYLYDEKDRCGLVDPDDAGNVESSLPPAHRNANPNYELPMLPVWPGVERVEQADGGVSLRVHGLEFARWNAGKLSCGLKRRRPSSVDEASRLARELLRVRAADAEDRQHPLYLQYPEGWLESQLRQSPQAVDASLLHAPLYGQVPVMSCIDRGVIDLLGVDYSGRLVIIEIKASADPRLPFQALDYWVRVRKHLLAGDFERLGYFPGITLHRTSPKILLVAPALEFHSTSETIVSAIDPAIEIVRIGISADWRRELRIMFRLRGAEHPIESGQD